MSKELMAAERIVGKELILLYKLILKDKCEIKVVQRFNGAFYVHMLKFFQQAGLKPVPVSVALKPKSWLEDILDV